jgi:hypothetical protein
MHAAVIGILASNEAPLVGPFTGNGALQLISFIVDQAPGGMKTPHLLNPFVNHGPGAIGARNIPFAADNAPGASGNRNIPFTLDQARGGQGPVNMLNFVLTRA